MRWVLIVPVVGIVAAGCGDDGGGGDGTADTSGPTTTADESSTQSTTESTSSASTMGPTTASSSDSLDTTSTGDCVPAGGGIEAESLTLTTSDGKSIAATLNRPTEGTCLPGLVLIHQFSSNRAQWDSMQPDMVGRGYVTLAIDLRGHGDSDPQDGDFNGLLDDPTQAPLDVMAAVESLSTHEQVDSTRVGAIGTSIGANLTVVAMTLDFGVAAIAPVSPRLSAIESLSGNPASIDVSNILCYAGETDGGGAQADTCNDLVASATGDASAVILPGTGAHGTAIFSMFPETLAAVLDYMDATL